MSADTDPTCYWEQQSMFNGQSTEILLRIGVVPDGDHLQFQVEATDLGSGDLIAMTSMQHCNEARAEEIFSRFSAAARELMLSSLRPF